ncbi:hypothetical protein [Agrococcus jejuensis]|uniref:hypothetical protein n=1 Tax=Agrococcus jejuensis TaxID=399736 RepID=UPI00119F4F43|nr:hypothetical protein [Agrococcus jejuensis]
MGSKDLGHKLKEVVEDTVANVGPRVGKKMAGRVDRQKQKADQIKDRSEQTDRDLAKDGKNPDGSKKAVEELETGSYNQLRGREVVGDQLQHDHIPSLAALKKAKEIELGRKLTRAEARQLKNDGAAVELTDLMHSLSRTYKGRNTANQVALDAQDLTAAMNNDLATLRQNLIDDGRFSSAEISDVLDRIRALNRERGI